MQIQGEELIQRLLKQRETVVVYDHRSFPQESIDPKSAARRARGGAFVGIGNRHQIHAIRPLGEVSGWRGGNHTTRRIVNDDGIIISPPQVREHIPLPR